MKPHIFVVSGLFLASVALATPAPPDPCKSLGEAVERSLKVIALNTADGAGDDSAVRETNRLQTKANELQLITIHLSLMRDNHCTMPKDPIVLDKYVTSARACVAEKKKSMFAEPPGCNMEKWGRPAVEINLPH